MSDSDLVAVVMTHGNIPPGQLYLYKSLFDAGADGLDLDGISAAGDRNRREVIATLGALGNRVRRAVGRVKKSPSRLMIERGGVGVYHLTAEVAEFIAARPSLESALGTSDMSRFYLHTPKAWLFAWHADGTSGELKEYVRRKGAVD